MIAKKLLNNIQKRGIYVVRQSQYVGQTPVQIVNNTISLETSFIDKVNTIDNLQRDIETNTNSITNINNSINGISTQLTTLNNSINTTNNNVSTNTQKIETNKQNITTNTQQIEAVKTKAETNENRINTLNTNVANKLDTATFDTFKTENTQVINDTLQQAKEYTNQQTSLTITTNEFAIPNKTFLGKQVYCRYFDAKEYNTSTNHTLVSGVERIVSINFERKRADNNWFYIPANSTNANQVLLKNNNEITLWLLDFSLGNSFTNFCRLYLEYTKR